MTPESSRSALGPPDPPTAQMWGLAGPQGLPTFSPAEAQGKACPACGNRPLTYSPDCRPSLWCSRCGAGVGHVSNTSESGATPMNTERILNEAPSTLSVNSVTVEITEAGQLEITFDAHDRSSWGEALSYEDTLYVAERLARWWADKTGARRA